MQKTNHQTSIDEEENLDESNEIIETEGSIKKKTNAKSSRMFDASRKTENSFKLLTAITLKHICIKKVLKDICQL
jgi:hypothetical protein